MKLPRHIEFAQISTFTVGRPYIVSLFEHQEFF